MAKSVYATMSDMQLRQELARLKALRDGLMAQANEKPADGTDPKVLELLKSQDPREYARIMESRAMWDKRSTKKADEMTPAEAKLLSQKLQPVKDQPSLDAAIQGIRALRPDMAALVPTVYEGNEEVIENLKLGTKAENKEETVRLEQLWKDATRGFTESAARGYDADKEYYAALVKKTHKLLAKKSPELWGDDKVPEQMQDSDLTKTPPAENKEGAKAADQAALEARIFGAKDEKPFDSKIDGGDILASDIDKWATKYGIDRNTPAYKDLVKAFNSKAADINDLYNVKVQEGLRSESRKQQAFSNFKDYLPAIKAVRAVESNPADYTNKSIAMGQMLKILSGLGVTDKERINTMVSLTNSDYQKKFLSQGKQFGEAFISKFIDNEQALIAEIANEMDANKLTTKLKENIPLAAFDYAKKTGDDAGEIKPAEEKIEDRYE